MIVDQHKKQLAEIEALLQKSRQATAAVAEVRAVRITRAPLLGAARIAPRRVDPVPPPAPQRDRFVDQVAARRIFKA